MRGNLDTTPPAVKALAATFGPHGMSSCGADMVRRLLTDPKMRNVWLTLKRTPAKPYALADWERVRMRTLDANSSAQDKACALFFFYAILAFGGLNIRPPVFTRKQLDVAAARWRSAAQACCAAKKEVYNWWHIEAKTAEFLEELALPPDELDVELVTALAIVSEHFERTANICDSPAWGPAVVIERSSKDRGSDEVRAQVRVLAAQTHKLFGRYLHGTLATVTTVALQTVITEKSVKNWCVGL
jgi:hypothetical protein